MDKCEILYAIYCGVVDIGDSMLYLQVPKMKRPQTPNVHDGELQVIIKGKINKNIFEEIKYT